MKKIIITVAVVSAFAVLISGCALQGKDKEEERQILGFVDGYNPMIIEVQETLMKNGYDPGAIDGKMSWKTREAIRDFQKANNLRKTGYVNQETRAKLDSYRIESETLTVSPMATQSEGISVFETQGAPAAPEEVTSEIVKERLMSSEWIKKIQQALTDAGLDPGPIDGKMGSKTKSAVMDFQKSKGLAADGVIGVKTWEELSKYFPGDVITAAPQTEPMVSPISSSQGALQGEILTSDAVRERISQEQWVKKVQQALINAGFDAGTVDGRMGPKTRTAISEFQKSKNLTPDGVIGPKTWEEISKYFAGAPQAAAQASASGGQTQTTSSGPEVGY